MDLLTALVCIVGIVALDNTLTVLIKELMCKCKEEKNNKEKV